MCEEAVQRVRVFKARVAEREVPHLGRVRVVAEIEKVELQE